MSIANLIVQPDAAYLMSDSGVWDGEGRLVELVDKRIVLPEHRVAITMTGSGPAGTVFEKVAQAYRNVKQASFTGGTFIAVVREVYRMIGADPELHNTLWLLAHYDEEARKPAGAVFWTSSSQGKPDQKPWEWHPSKGAAMPRFDAHAALGKPRNINDPAEFDVRAEAMNIVHAQRERRGVNGSLHAGGQIRLTTVSSRGVEDEVLHDYADEICVA